MIIWYLTGLLCILEVKLVRSCPTDIMKKAQDCFADLASGVTNNDKMSIAGNLPLDYQKIKEYCEKDGHMSRFLLCVDKLLEQCTNQTESDALHQLINPDKVRSSVPHLCENIEEIEANAECMNHQMNKNSDCKMAAYDLIRQGMSETTGNVTAMFNIQCKFFSVLAECQRTAVADECGRNLGDLHANFLLSFVPNTCSREDFSDILLPQLKKHPELEQINTKNNLQMDKKTEVMSDDPGSDVKTEPGRSSRSKKSEDKKKTESSHALGLKMNSLLLASLLLLLANI